ncbi:thioredoxin family protein [Candidatus Gottesmanbacteria bacterium]|nr:thioredoxin family protein [Candidatus Gottesmanbacteria bacterium]
MKQQWFIIGGIIIAFGIVGAVLLKSQKASPSKPTTQKEETKKEDAMMGKGFVMKDGKMMIEENGKMTAMIADATLNDGTKVTTSGQVMKKDGTTMTLTEDQSIWMDGTFDAGNMKKEREPSGTMMKSSFAGKQLAGTSSPYIEFNKADYGKAKSEGKIIFLDFYANWCPICRVENPEFIAGFNSLTTDKVVGFRVNYQDSDTDADEKALAKEMGITHQNTKLIFKDGKEVKRTLEEWDKETLTKELNAVVGS